MSPQPDWSCRYKDIDGTKANTLYSQMSRLSAGVKPSFSNTMWSQQLLQEKYLRNIFIVFVGGSTSLPVPFTKGILNMVLFSFTRG